MSFLLALISAKNGNPPADGGADGFVDEFADFDGNPIGGAGGGGGGPEEFVFELDAPNPGIPDGGGGGGGGADPDDILVFEGGGGGGAEPDGILVDGADGILFELFVDSMTLESSLFLLISAKNGKPPIGGAGGAELPFDFCDVNEGGGGGADGTFVGFDVNDGGGGAIEGTGGGGGASNEGGGGVREGDVYSSELTELTEVDFKWPDFFGLVGGSFGANLFGLEVGAAGGGGAEPGKGGGALGRGGAEELVVLLSILGFLECGLNFGIEGVSGGCVTNVGICGAEGGTIPALLSLPTCFNLGTPPANISPNCGAEGGMGEEPSELEGTLELEGPMELEGAVVPTDIFPSITGLDLSTVTAFLSLAPFLISPNKASLPIMGGGGALPPPIAGGGGGGGGGGPAIVLYQL